MLGRRSARRSSVIINLSLGGIQVLQASKLQHCTYPLLQAHGSMPSCPLHHLNKQKGIFRMLNGSICSINRDETRKFDGLAMC